MIFAENFRGISEAVWKTRIYGITKLLDKISHSKDDS